MKLSEKAKKILTSEPLFLAITCSMLIIGQYSVNSASRLTAECDDEKLKRLSMRIEKLDASLLQNDANMALLRLQLVAHDRGESLFQFDGPEAKQAAKAKANFERVDREYWASVPKWEKECQGYDDIRDQSTLVLAAFGALLTFIGFQLGKRSERNASLGDPII